jgi:Flp pilus assembly protein TadD
VLGRLAFASGDFKWALSLLEQSARKNAADPELSYDLATAYYSVGRVHDAESAMNGAVRSGEPFARANDAKQFLDLIALAASPARALEAQPRVAEILRTDPANVPALMALGIAAEQRGDAGAAVKAYEQALNRYPEFVPAMRQLAILLADNPGNDPRTYELATKARESLPNDPAIAKALGVLLYRRGDFRGAIRFLNENAQKEAPDGRTMYYLGMAHYQLKESQEAGKALQKALGLNLPAPLADEARRILAGLK